MSVGAEGGGVRGVFPHRHFDRPPHRRRDWRGALGDGGPHHDGGERSCHMAVEYQADVGVLKHFPRGVPSRRARGREGRGRAWRRAGFLYYMLVYVFMNLGAFCVVVATGAGGKERVEIEEYAGMGDTRPGLAFAMAIFMISLAGLPPTGGFVAKFYVFSAAVKAGHVILAVIAVLNSVIAVLLLSPHCGRDVHAGRPPRGRPLWSWAGPGLTPSPPSYSGWWPP